MSCELLEKVALYADDELDPAAREKMAAHLHACPDCTAVLAAHLDLKKAVRVAGKQFSAPPELHAAVFKQVRQRAGVSPWWKWGLAPVTVVLLAALAYLLWPGAKPDPMIAGLVDQHVTTLASTTMVDVVSTDRHTVKPWFQGRLPFTFNLPELEGSPYTLVGGKMAYVQQTPGAELVYQAGRHRVSIFIFPARDKETRAPAWNQELSFTVSSWSSDGRQCYLVTDASKDEVGRLATMFQEANRS